MAFADAMSHACRRLQKRLQEIASTCNLVKSRTSWHVALQALTVR